MRANQQRVLVVDGHGATRDGLARLLATADFVVACAKDGVSALDEAARFDPDIVLTDLELPGLDGIELCTRLRERDATLPVVLMTVHDEVLLILRSLRAGVDDFLTKPLDIELVLTSMRRALDRRVRRAEPSVVRSVTQKSRLSDTLVAAAPRLHHDGPGLECREHTVGELLADVCDLQPIALQRRLVLDVQPPQTRRTLFCDRHKMSQALASIVNNAIRFSPSGGTVSVWASEDDDSVRFGVRDRGPGIPAAAQLRLFALDESPDSGRAAIGLGLHIAKGIVDAHGGTISVVSSEGFGSTFFVSIPTAIARQAG